MKGEGDRIADLVRRVELLEVASVADSARRKESEPRPLRWLSAREVATLQRAKKTGSYRELLESKAWQLALNGRYKDQYLEHWFGLKGERIPLSGQAEDEAFCPDGSVLRLTEELAALRGLLGKDGYRAVLIMIADRCGWEPKVDNNWHLEWALGLELTDFFE